MTPAPSHALLDDDDIFADDDIFGDDGDDDIFGGDSGDDALETLEPLAGLAVLEEYKCNDQFVSGVIHVRWWWASGTDTSIYVYIGIICGTYNTGFPHFMSLLYTVCIPLTDIH